VGDAASIPMTAFTKGTAQFSCLLLKALSLTCYLLAVYSALSLVVKMTSMTHSPPATFLKEVLLESLWTVPQDTGGDK